MKQEFNEVVDYVKANATRPLVILVKGNVANEFGLKNLFEEVLTPVQQELGCPLPGADKRDLGFGCGAIYKGQFTAFSFSDSAMFEKAQSVLTEKGYDIQPVIVGP